MQYPISHSKPIVLAAATAWLVWLAGLIFNRDIVPIAMALANFAATYSLYQMGRVFPKGVKRALQGLALGLLILAIAELWLGYAWVVKVETAILPEATYAFGALVIAFWGTYFSWALERLGLRDKGHGIRVLGGALLGSLTLILLIFWLKPIAPIQLLYAFVAFYLTLLFATQLVVMIGIRLRRNLQIMAWALVLVSASRLISIFGGPEQVLLYGIFWLGAMSLLVWDASKPVK